MWRHRRRLEWCCREPRNTRSHQNWKKQAWVLPCRLWRECAPTDTLSVDFWPPELWEKKFVVWSHQFEVICYNSLRKLWVHSPPPATQFWALLSTQHLVHDININIFCRLPKSESKFKWQWIVSVYLLSNLAFLSRWLQALLSSGTFSRSLICFRI